MVGRTIRLAADGWSVEILDQTLLPHAEETRRLASLEDVADAIAAMRVRGAPLIGAAAAYGVALAMRADPSDASLTAACRRLADTRPTAVNLRAALDRMTAGVLHRAAAERAAAAYAEASAICAEDVAMNRAIAEHGLRVLRTLAPADGPLRVLTHCNAGWLATVGWGTALAPVYRAHQSGMPVHVWVSETRPRNQGLLTAWELSEAGVPCTLIADNAAGHLLQRGAVHVCLVGSDRTTAAGDVCNKIGTYLKALAAHDHGVPFYACVPGPSVDWTARTVADVPIEERDGDEVRCVAGQDADGRPTGIRLAPPAIAVANPGFDVTPGRLVSGLITERGVCPATAEGLQGLYPEQAA